MYSSACEKLELQEELIETGSARENRRQEFEKNFTYDGYKVIRKELFAHLRDPAIVIRKDSISFNTACINGIDDVTHVHIMFNDALKRIVVQGCDPNEKDALRWCVEKEGNRKTRRMSCKPFAEYIYEQLEWDPTCRYKILGYRIEHEGAMLYVFDLTIPEIFEDRKRPPKGQQVDIGQDQRSSRKGYYAGDVAHTFSVPVETHREESKFAKLDGYISMGLLNGISTTLTAASGGAKNDLSEREEEKATEGGKKEAEAAPFDPSLNGTGQLGGLANGASDIRSMES